MNVKQLVAGVATLAVVGVAGVLAATPAAAVPHGPDGVETPLTGKIYFLSKAEDLTKATTADIVQTGTGQLAGTNWAAIDVDTACPAGSTNTLPIYRLPNAGAQETWPEGQVAPQSWTVDAQGRSVNYEDNQGFSLPEVADFLIANGGSADIEFGLVCEDDNNHQFGVFTTTIHASTLAKSSTISLTSDTGYEDPNYPIVTWSPTNASLPDNSAATTTAVAASPSTVTEGGSVTLTATVAPAAATGTVDFKAGTTDLGTATLANGTATLTTTTIPAGSQTITASYAGVAGQFGASSGTTTVTVTANPVATTTALTVSAPEGKAYSAVTLGASVTAAKGAANGTVKFYDGDQLIGSTPCAAGVVAPFTISSLGAGDHSLQARFVGSAPYLDSQSSVVAQSLEGAGPGSAPFNAVVAIPAGAITVTTPFTTDNPVDLGTAVLSDDAATYAASADLTGISVKDTRAGNLGFAATIVADSFRNATGDTFSSSYAYFDGVAADQVAGNALQATDVTVTADNKGLDAAKTFATYPGGKSIGSVTFHGVLGLVAPTSVKPGSYTSLVTITAM